MRNYTKIMENPNSQQHSQNDQQSPQKQTEKYTPKRSSVYRAPKREHKGGLELYIRKRDGKREQMSFNKILWRIQNLSEDLQVTPAKLTQAVISDLHDGIESRKIDEIAARKAHNWCTTHPDYDILASRIAVSNHQKETLEPFLQVVWELHKAGLVCNELYEVVQDNEDVLEKAIDYTRDYYLTYHGFKTFEYAYSMRIEGKPWERPQHMWMRVAIGIHGDDIDAVLETYEWMSSKYFIHATPTLFNAGTLRPQMSSCFLLAMKEEIKKGEPCDSIEKIYETLVQCALISKSAGGIGISISNVRPEGSLIKSAGRGSSGIVPMLRVYNQTARYVDQGRRRPGAFAIYLEPWHPDVFDWLDLKKNTGDPELRARDLHYALWIPDLFMKRVEENAMWSLMDPVKCPELINTHSAEFEEHYLRYEKQGTFVKQIEAWKLWTAIITSQIETGEPYMLYKDACNAKSNQQNLGTIRSSNLCVAPYTRILTKNGYCRIDKFADQNVEIWNGFEWSQVTVKKTGNNQTILRVSCSDGTVLDCTPDHKFYVNLKYYSKNHLSAFKDENCTKMVKAKDLKIGDKLIKFELPRFNPEKSTEFLEPYTHGFFCGDGTYSNISENIHQCNYKSHGKTNYCKRHRSFALFDKLNEKFEQCQATVGKGTPLIYLYGEKKNLEKYFNPYLSYDNNGHQVLALNPHIEQKFVVPLGCNLETKMKWLSGFADADGTIARNGSNESLQLGNIEKQFLNDIRLMLSSVGIFSKVTKNKNADRRLLPDGKGGYKFYECKDNWRLLVTSNGLQKLCSLGFKPNRLQINATNKPNRDAKQFITIKNVEQLSEKTDTYCFTEPKLGLGCFEGIVTGQCSEIVEYSDNDEVAVCNLSSLALPSFVINDEEDVEPYFDHDQLMHVTKIVTRNLNKIIDKNFYPIPETKTSNMRNRPIGIGVQGLADTFIALRIPFDSPEAEQLNKEIFETIYFGAMQASCEIAEEEGAYESYQGSPISQGKFQFDLWGVSPTDRWNWTKLRNNIGKYGVRNSLTVALMPTASTSQLLGFNECFEPYTSNIYTRKTRAGTYKVINRQLILDLIKLGLWSPEMKDKIIYYKGSVQNIPEIPSNIKALYKTAWDMSQKVILNLAAGRAPYVDQSQSMNLFVAEPNFAKLSSMHFYGWKLGLKTGQYYLRSRAAVDAIQSTIDAKLVNKLKNLEQNAPDSPGKDSDEGGIETEGVCYMEEGCLTCGS